MAKKRRKLTAEEPPGDTGGFKTSSQPSAATGGASSSLKEERPLKRKTRDVAEALASTAPGGDEEALASTAPKSKARKAAVLKEIPWAPGRQPYDSASRRKDMLDNCEEQVREMGEVPIRDEAALRDIATMEKLVREASQHWTSKIGQEQLPHGQSRRCRGASAALGLTAAANKKAGPPTLFFI